MLATIAKGAAVGVVSTLTFGLGGALVAIAGNYLYDKGKEQDSENSAEAFDTAENAMIDAYNSMREALVTELTGAFARIWKEVIGQLESQGKVRVLQKLAKDISEAAKEE